MISLMLKHRELEEEREEKEGGKKPEKEKEEWLSKKSKVSVRPKGNFCRNTETVRTVCRMP